MERDVIREIRIDQAGCLCVIPSTQKFPYIWREAVEVHWDNDSECLYSPRPCEWTYTQWFRQILAAAAEQSCRLCISNETIWSNVPDETRREILQIAEHI
ncbi:MAG: hypothetical protein A2017_03675 [Lentisphaerae bacterium GWF2_44_16]|nr:MAG: hypothetical protein A2017_03675 [Lentisphaerae bacterium GWF2_44_16]